MERQVALVGSTEIYTQATYYGMGSKLLGEQLIPKATGDPL